MGLIQATMNVTLDGCCDHRQVIADDEFHRRITEVFEGASALIFGRVTFDLLQSYWPRVAAEGSGTPSEVEFARVLNGKPKHVVSRTDPPPGWSATRLMLGRNGDEIRTLKKSTPGTLLLVASPTLARSLVQLALVDEYHLAVQPIFAGQGPTFMSGLTSSQHLRLRESVSLRSGVVINRYGITSPPR